MIGLCLKKKKKKKKKLVFNMIFIHKMNGGLHYAATALTSLV
jgi:hypothetical protein